MNNTTLILINHTVRFVSLLVFLLLFLPINSYAYLDPSTGSYVLQVILGALIGGFYTLKLYWRRVKAYFQRPAPKIEDVSDSNN